MKKFKISISTALFLIFAITSLSFGESNKVTFKYFLSRNAHNIKIEIYTVGGAKVKKLIDTSQTRGLKSIIWDGKDHNGKLVGSGIYDYRITVKFESNGNPQTKRGKFCYIK